MTFIKSMAGELLIGLLAILAAAALGYSQGAKDNEQKWLTNQAKVERSARADYVKEVRRGEVAVANYLKDTRALTEQFNDLTEKFNALRKRTPLLVARSGITVCDQRSVVAAGAHTNTESRWPTTLEPPVVAGRSPADVAAEGVHPADSPVYFGLTAGAVWMWNSALAGADQPSGACGAADPTASACAAATPHTLDEAWDNHIANAQACAANRLAHQRLIDFVQSQNARKASSPTYLTAP